MRFTLCLRRATVALVCAFQGYFCSALELGPLFSNHAVLQQGRPIPIWGRAESGTEVTVEFRGRTVRGTAENGVWMVRLPSQRAGGPDDLIVRGEGQTLTRTNILVGEVWVASGQSNMEWPMSASEEPQEAIAQSANDSIRLFTVPKRKANEPVSDIEAVWERCEPGVVKDFSAVAYYFGKALHEARGVPVGLIDSSWGGSPAEVWIREEVLAASPEFKRDILDVFPEQKSRYDAAVQQWEEEARKAREEGREPSRPRPWGIWKPSELYNGMIHPLIPFSIAGAIWYQGESNAGRADQYSRLFPALIQNWRDDWKQKDLPFLFVQLAPWDKNRKRTFSEIAAAPGESDWAELREAQLQTFKSVPKAGMVVITDVGDKDDIHPRKKREVGERLALQARALAYGERIPFSGPIARRVDFKDGQAILSFQFAEGGLEARGGELTGFQICGSDRQWVWAEARIDGRRVIVSSPKVEEPVAVRFGWSDYPIINLYNKAGLPASPFRTDDFRLTTAVER